MDYFSKVEVGDYGDLRWNLPEQKQGIVNVVGGNAQSFRTEVKTTEFLTTNFPIKEVKLIVPNALRGNLPDLPNIEFLSATDSGSFSNNQELADTLKNGDYNLILGDLSKNSVTGGVITSACQLSEKPTLLTRDTIDLLTNNTLERTLMNEELIFFASMAQLQKLLRAVYYPKMLLLSQSLVQVVEILHKFTLSYPVKIITIHDGQIVLAENGEVRALPLEKSGYSPITIWGGELAAKIAGLNLYNPHNFIPASIAAI